MTVEQAVPADPLLASRRWRRRFASVQAAAVAGLVCAVGWSFSLRGLLGTPSLGASDAAIAEYYRDGRTGPSAVILSVFAPRVAALVMFSTAGLARATGALPMWLIVTTYVVGIGELVNVTIRTASIYVFPAWIALVSVVLLARRAPIDLEAAGVAEPVPPAPNAGATT